MDLAKPANDEVAVDELHGNCANHEEEGSVIDIEEDVAGKGWNVAEGTAQKHPLSAIGRIRGCRLENHWKKCQGKRAKTKCPKSHKLFPIFQKCHIIFFLLNFDLIWHWHLRAE
jgi:hypothetical protein